MEQSIPCEDNFSGTVLHEPADAVLSMTWGIESLHSYVANLESLAVLRSLCNTLAVLASNYRLALKLGMG